MNVKTTVDKSFEKMIRTHLILYVVHVLKVVKDAVQDRNVLNVNKIITSKEMCV